MKPSTGKTLAIDNLFIVIVPVLSVQRTFIVAASSAALNRVTKTPFFANCLAPNDIVTVNIAGRATGIADNRTTNAIGKISKRFKSLKKEPAKVETKREVKKSPEINRTTRQPEKVQKNANRKENKVIEKKKVIEKRPESNANHSTEKKTGVNRIERPNNSNKSVPNREVRVQKNNKPRNETPGFENRTQEKRNTNIRERRNVEERRVRSK